MILVLHMKHLLQFRFVELYKKKRRAVSRQQIFFLGFAHEMIM